MLINPDFPVAPTIEEVPDVYLKEESVRPPTDSEVSVTFYRVTASDFRQFESALDRDHTVTDWSMAMDFGRSRMYRVHLGPETEYITPELAAQGIYVVFIESAGRGWRFKMEVPDRDSLSGVWEHCREEGIEFHLEKLHSWNPEVSDPVEDSLKALLTDRQMEVVHTAVRMGYYDQGGASAEEVAAELDIAPSTLSTHLRRAIAKILTSMCDQQ